MQWITPVIDIAITPNGERMRDILSGDIVTAMSDNIQQCIRGEPSTYGKKWAARAARGVLARWNANVT